MARYVTCPRLAPWDGGPDGENYLSRQIHEREPVNTGLLDQSGKPIFRISNTIGFVTPKD